MKKRIKAFEDYLKHEEKSKATIAKYIHDVLEFVKWLGKQTMSKQVVSEYKQILENNYSPNSVNSTISSLNSFFCWMNCPEYKVKNIRVQKKAFREPRRDLTRQEYERLLRAAHLQGKKRLCLIMQTICSTGIRVSELKYITVEAAKSGIASIKCKGKNRIILIPDKMCKVLLAYAREKNIKTGAVFVTRSGRNVDRSNIWTEMKKLCDKAGVIGTKVFPHNLRHLFGKIYYTLYQDIVRLADILGHESINTTRIYTKESWELHRSRIQKLGLIIDFYSKNTT